MTMQFGDHKTALKFRDLIRRIIRDEIGKLHPIDSYGVVVDVDYAGRVASVLPAGATTPSSAAFPATLQPSRFQYVRVGGRASNRHVDAITTPPIWWNLNLGNGWGGAPSATPQFMRDPLGIVHLRGVVSSGTAAQAAAVLPADLGYCPPQPYDFAASSSLTTFTVITVNPDGSIIPHDSTATVRLDGITFDVNGGT